MFLKCQEEQTSQNDTDYWALKTLPLGLLKMQHQGTGPLVSFASPPKIPSSSLLVTPHVYVRQAGAPGNLTTTSWATKRLSEAVPKQKVSCHVSISVTSCCHSWGLWGVVRVILSPKHDGLVRLSSQSQAVLGQTEISPAGVLLLPSNLPPPHLQPSQGCLSTLIPRGGERWRPTFHSYQCRFKIAGICGF